MERCTTPSPIKGKLECPLMCLLISDKADFRTREIIMDNEGPSHNDM